VKAVNLVPSDAGRGGSVSSRASLSPVHALLGLLAIAVAFVTVYVLTSNTISERQSKIAALNTEVAQATAEAARLTNYAAFATLAEARAETVREIAASRFDWKGALSDLAKVVPHNTSLQSLLGTVATGTTAGGASGGSGATTGTLRGDIAAPAFEIRGCTDTQDDVARLMSRLRLINGVTRVTLSDSQKGDTAQPAATVSTAGSSGASTGCKPNTPTFDLVIFFQALPSAGPQGVASVSSVPVLGTTGAATPAGTTTTPAAGSTATGTTVPAAATTPVTSPAPPQPVSNTTPASGG
jgi:Tfp pilus assembly protein PilN